MAGSARTVGVVLFPGFEVLDVYGPIDCFAKLGTDVVRVVTVAEREGPVPSAQLTRSVADIAFHDCPKLDILVVPGGQGTRSQVNNATLVAWIRERALAAELVLTVCTGAALLARTGLLDGVRATTNKRAFHWVQTQCLGCSAAACTERQGPAVQWVAQARWVEDGRFVTSSGISAGTDMTLAVIGRLYGEARADEVADILEWDRHRDPAWDPFAAKAGLV